MRLSADERIKLFCDCVNKGIDAWIEAGRLLNELVEEDPSVRQKIFARNPWMTKYVLGGFERIGRREIYPRLLLDSSPGARRLIRLPYDEQERLYCTVVEVAVINEGRVSTERKSLQSLTNNEADLVFGKNSIRPVEQQKRILTEKKADSVVHSPLTANDFDFSDDNEDIEDRLALASAALARARELIVSRPYAKSVGNQITMALNAIGKARLELKQK